MKGLRRAGEVLGQHFADPGYFADRFRAASTELPSSSQRLPDFEPAGLSAGATIRRLMRDYPRRRRLRSARPPGAFERWTARPGVFIVATIVGVALVLVTLHVPRSAPLSRQILPIIGGIAACAGILGAVAYAENRWPRIRRFTWGALVLFGLASFAAGVVLSDRAISPLLANGVPIGVIISAILPSRGKISDDTEH